MPDDTTSTRRSRRGRELDPYVVLEVSPHASPEVINAAYRALARRLHPDLNSEKDATRLMGELNAAYEALSDPAWRAAYDARAASSVTHRQRIERPRSRELFVPSKRLRAADSDRAGVGAVRLPAQDLGHAGLMATITLIAVVVLAVGVAWWAVSDALDDSLAGSRDMVPGTADRSVLAQLSSNTERPVLDFDSSSGTGSSVLRGADGSRLVPLNGVRSRSTNSQP